MNRHSLMKSILLCLAFAATGQAATVATVAVLGAAPGFSSSTFANYSNGGGAGAGAGTRIGIASTVSASRIVAGTSLSAPWTIAGAGTITVSYYLDNTVAASFRSGVQGLYDASGGIAANASAVQTALNAFTGLSGVSATTIPDPIPVSLNTATSGGVAFTTTYTIAEGSAAIGKPVAIGFYSAWNSTGSYIFGRENNANNVVIDFVAVPEPGAASWLGLFGTIALIRRRR